MEENHPFIVVFNTSNGKPYEDTFKTEEDLKRGLNAYYLSEENENEFKVFINNKDITESQIINEIINEILEENE